MTTVSSLLASGALLLSLLCLCFAAVVDARVRKIPNVLTLIILLLYPVYAASSPEASLWLEHLATFAVILGFGLWIYARKWIGAGDVKLLATLGLWAGPDLAPLLLIITTMAGGLLSLSVAGATLLRRRAKKDLDATPIRALPVSYGVAIATGGLCVFLMLSHKSLLLN